MALNNASTQETVILTNRKLLDILGLAIEQRIPVRMCYMSSGKWIRNTIFISNLSQNTIIVTIPSEESQCLSKIQINQPVGISYQLDYDKFIFDTIITAVESASASGDGRLLLEMPEKMEKMPRRSYERQAVPSNLNVQVLFWHRGYIDNCEQRPLESYWQGKLVNLSAGGAQIAVGLSIKDCFRTGQLVGVQFTPSFYQKPILIEGQIIHLQTDTEKNKLHIGVEFLGLEVSMDGRTVLHRLTEIVDEYAKMSSGSGANTTPSE